jgi:hypothetical protein
VIEEQHIMTISKEVTKGIAGGYLAIVAIRAIALIIALIIFCCSVAILLAIFLPGILHPTSLPFATFPTPTPLR